MLNVTRPAVTRQMFGNNVLNEKHNGQQLRYTYGYLNGTNPAGTDPARYVTKPFDKDMLAMSNYLHQHLLANQKNLDFEGLDLTIPFNSCIALIYTGGEAVGEKNQAWDGTLM